VTVHVLLDGFGSKTLPRSVVEDLRGAGVQLLFYRPKVSPWSLKRGRLRRMHRKVAVIDTRIAFVGGINIIDDMDAPGQIPPRYDYAVAVEGPLLAEIHESVRRLWILLAWSQLRLRRSRRRVMPQPAVSGEMEAAFVRRDNLRHRHDIEEAYLDAIASARHEIILANAYFLPGRHFRQALIQAAGRGVRVVLLVQGRVEYLLLHYASRALYGVLLGAGIEIYSYHRSFLHAKVAVIDGNWATVGSSNIDPFSLLLAQEANVVATDSGFAATLRDSLLQAMDEGAQRIAPDSWKLEPFYRRFLAWASYGLVRLLMGVTGYARGYE
jgi:cardiolipin synthase